MDQILQLCTARTVRSDAAVRLARFGPFRLIYYPEGDTVGKPRMTHRQSSYGSVVMKVSVVMAFPGSIL